MLITYIPTLFFYYYLEDQTTELFMLNLATSSRYVMLLPATFSKGLQHPLCKYWRSWPRMWWLLGSKSWKTTSQKEKKD